MWCFMAPSGPYLRGRPRFRLTGSGGGLATGMVPEPETEPPMVLCCCCMMEEGEGDWALLSIWNCMAASEEAPPPAPPMDWRMAVGLMLMLGMGRMTECIPASEEGLCCPPPPPVPPSMRRCCCCA